MKVQWKIRLAQSFTLTFALLLASSSFVLASNYPADYSIKYTCQENGPVKACRAIQVGYGLAVLDLYYSGRLANSRALSLYVKVNYNDGSRTALFPMNKENGSASDVFRTRITGGCLIGKNGGCEKSGTAEMRDLLIWAQGYGMSLNELNFEVAVVDQDGNWDNNIGFGSNYPFSFPESR